MCMCNCVCIVREGLHLYEPQGEPSHLGPPVISNHRLLHQSTAVLITHLPSIHVHTHIHEYKCMSTEKKYAHASSHKQRDVRIHTATHICCNTFVFSCIQRLLCMDLCQDYLPNKVDNCAGVPAAVKASDSLVTFSLWAHKLVFE